MTNDEVKIGRVYTVKVGKNTIGVRIMGQTPDGGYNAVNVNTDKIICIKSAQRLCGLYNPKAAAKTPTLAQVENKYEAPAHATTSAEEPANAKRGGLNAAVRVLEEAGEPLNCSTIVERMLQNGYWATGGKTPAATINAAITREIKTKGELSRFRKVQRGLFTLAK
jgi:hypothetical protein